MDANPDQFGETQEPVPGGRRFLRRSSTGPYSASDLYSYGRYTGGRLWDVDLSMTVVHKPARTAFAYPREHIEAPTVAQTLAKEDLDTPAENPYQGKLFGMHTTPGESKVDYVVGTEASRIHFPTMLGIAENQTQRDFGRSLQPTTDLSPHSAKLVENLKGRGVLDPATRSKAVNNMAFRGGPAQLVNNPHIERVPEAEVKAGRRSVRTLLKKRKKS